MRISLALVALCWRSEAKCPGAKDDFSAAETKTMLDLVNKFRKTVGAPPIKWDHALQCQAQKCQDDKGDGLHHSNSYSLPIKAGENLAGGHDPVIAAWMWFSEYSQQLPGKGEQKYPIGHTGHYTAMVWKANEKMGCGISRTGQWKGIIRCQFSGKSPPNMMGQYNPQVNDFNGEVSKFKSAGVDPAEVQKYLDKFKGWGILHPGASSATNIGAMAAKVSKKADPDAKLEKALTKETKVSDSKSGGGGGGAMPKKKCNKPTGPKESCPGTQDVFTKDESKRLLALMNKFRKAVGSPPMKWDQDLMCQAQKSQDEKGDGLHHVVAWKLKIPSGENLAGGCDVENAGWMWMMEYVQQGQGAETSRYPLMKTGHYTGMNWKSNTKVGCGIARKGKWGGIVRCQFAGGNPLPNMAGAYLKQVPDFHGEAAKFTAAGIKPAEVKKQIKHFNYLFHPKPWATANLKLWDDETEGIFETNFGHIFATSSIVCASAMMLVGGTVFGYRRYSRSRTELQQVELLETDNESGHE